MKAAVDHVAALPAGPLGVGGPISADVRVTLNFHPDRLVAGRTVLAGIVDAGVYLSQFVTGVGNGGLTAYRGGDRWWWESRLFGGVYDDQPAAARPVYGALNHGHDPLGGAPRFGSAHLRLRPGVLERTTFCFPDSVTQPVDRAVHARVSTLVEAARRWDGDLLDAYVEAQVHGPVRLAHDVEALVLDPSFRGTAIEAVAAELACPVEWHGGVRLTAAQLRQHPGYRGEEIAELGARIAAGARCGRHPGGGDRADRAGTGWGPGAREPDGGGTRRVPDEEGLLDPERLGRAAPDHDPQQLKEVWHLLARYGRGTPGFAC